MARRLVFTQQPTRTRAGEAISPPPRLEIRAGDSVDPRVVNGQVKARIMSGPAGAVLSGETTVEAPGGVAVFENLRPSIPGDYVLAAECDPASLEVIPRPSVYRYVGSFPGVEVGQTVEIVGTQATQGQVVGFGPGWVEVQDSFSGAPPQQEAVRPLLPMNSDRVLQSPTQVNGVNAAWHFAADSVGIDPEGSLGFWEARGGSLVEGLGRWPNCASTASLVPLDSPLGGGRGVTAAVGTAEVRTPQEFAGSMLIGPGGGRQGYTIAILAAYRPWVSRQEEIVLSSTVHEQDFRLWSYQGSARPDFCGVRGSNGTGGIQSLMYWVGRSPTANRWNLLTCSVFYAPSATRWTLLPRVNGYLPPGFGNLDYSFSSTYAGAGLLEALTLWAGGGGAIAQVAIYPEPMDEDWHLEQARRCGVAP